MYNKITTELVPNRTEDYPKTRQRQPKDKWKTM